MYLTAVYAGSTVDIALTFSSASSVQVQMPAGQATFFVRIIDNMNGVTIYNLGSTYTVTVTLSQSLLSSVMSNMLINDCTSSVVTQLQAGNLQQTALIATSLGVTLNGMASNNVTDTNNRVAVRDILVNSLCDLPISDVSSMKLVASSLSSVTNQTTENSLSTAVN